MKLIAFDCESNGLHGEVFAIGAVCLDDQADNSSFSFTFEGIAPIPDPLDTWVVDNVLPHLRDTMVYESTLALRNAFWAWLQANKQNALIVADFGVPVEAGLLAQCQKDDPSRTWDHPYPLHELGTMLLAAGDDPDVDRHKYVNSRQWQKHNPLHDAWVVVTCWRLAVHRIKLARRDAFSGKTKLLE